MRLPSQPPPMVILIDSREQTPWDFEGHQTEPASLPTGDYSLRGLESHVAVERKSRDDLLGCVGRDRERFDREVQRLLAYRTRALVIEASWADLKGGHWRGKVTPEQVMGSITGWMALGLPVVVAGSRSNAEDQALRILRHAHRRTWRALRTFAAMLPDEVTA